MQTRGETRHGESIPHSIAKLLLQTEAIDYERVVRVVFDFEIEEVGARWASLEVKALSAAPRAERSRIAFRQLVLP